MITLSVTSIALLFKIAMGLSIFAGVPVFFFKLLTGRYSFVKAGASQSGVGRAVFSEDPQIQAAFEEVRQSVRCERGGEPPAPRSAPHAPITVTIARDGSFKLDIPNDAFALDETGR
jgi:hypothetical protein